MDFSGIETTSAEKVYQGFNSAVESYLKGFLLRYGYPKDLIDEVMAQASPADKMRRFYTLAPSAKVFLLIDEYDHFANSILADNLQLFQSIVGKGGFVRSFFEAIKGATQRGVIDRLFITGVTPIVLDNVSFA